MILLNSLTFFAFAVSRTEFYSLAKRIFCSQDGIIHVQPSVFRINSFSRSISLSWNQAFKRRKIEISKCFKIAEVCISLVYQLVISGEFSALDRNPIYYEFSQFMMSSIYALPCCIVYCRFVAKD